MADCCNGLVRHSEFADNGHCAFVHAQDIGVHLAAGEKKRVVARTVGDFIDRLLYGNALSPVLLVPSLDFALFETDNCRLETGILEICLRLHKLGLFEAVSGEDHYALCHGCIPLISCYPCNVWG